MSVDVLARPAPVEWDPGWGPAPRFATQRNPDRPSRGPVAARLAERLGRPLFPWQQRVVDVALEVEPDGDWAYDEVAVTAPRRSGKTFLVQAITADRCGSAPALAMLTAQHRLAARERWMEIADHPKKVGLMQTRLGPALKSTTGVGNEVLRWKSTGSEFRPFAPNESAIHGDEPDLVFIDELWALSLADKQMLEQAYMPAWSIKPGQAWMLSTAGTPRSTWLQDVRARGRRAVTTGKGRIAYFEWSVPPEVGGVPVRQLPDAELIRVTIEHHPRRGHDLREQYLVDQLDRLGRPGFLRAYANLDSDDDDGALVGSDVLARTRSKQRIPRDAPVGVGVAVDPERREASVCVCWAREDGVRLVQLVRHAPGIRWVGPYVADMPAVAQVAIVNSRLGRDAAGVVEEAGRDVLRVSQADMVAASGRWLSGLTEDGSVTHDGKSELADQLRAASLPAGKAWQSRRGEPITVVEAHTLAVWAADHEPAPVVPLPEFKVL